MSAPSLLGVVYPDCDPHDIVDGPDGEELVYRVGEVTHGTPAAAIVALASDAGYAVTGTPDERVDPDGGTSWHVPVARR